MQRRAVLHVGGGLLAQAGQPYDFLGEALDKFAHEYNQLMADFKEGKNSVNKRGEEISRLWRKVERTEGWPSRNRDC